MRKLNLKLGGIREMLSREQMKKVVGGYGSGDCSSGCTSNSDCSAPYPNCTSVICTNESKSVFKECTA